MGNACAGRKKQPADESESSPGPSSPHLPPLPPPPPPPPLAAAPSSSNPAEAVSEYDSDQEDTGTIYHSDSDPDRDAGHSELAEEKLGQILSGLDSDAGPSVQVATLTEVCEIISFCNEDSVPDVVIDMSVPPLVRLVSHESNPEIMLLAARAITYLCDVMPTSSTVLDKYGAIPVLCSRLLVIEYVDVAEQCLKALEKISQTRPIACLRAGTIMAALSYIDFFQISVQRVAVSIVANVCKKLPLDRSAVVMEAVPLLCNLLQYEDPELVETVATCLIRIADCFSNSAVLLDELCKHRVIKKLLNLIAVDGRMKHSQTTYTRLIGLFAKLASGSPVAVRTLFELNISSIMTRILTTSDLSLGTPYSVLEDGHPNQVHEVLKLMNQLIVPATTNHKDFKLLADKTKFLVDQSKFLHQFAMDILPVLIQVVNSGANIYVSYGCVSIIDNIVHFSSSDVLLDLLKNINISSFLAGSLARKDHHIQNSTLKVVEILMQKLPGVFSSFFIKEGVVYAISELLKQEDYSPSMALQSRGTKQPDNQVAARDVSRCLCYAFDSGCSPPSERKTCKLGKDTSLAISKRILSTYFTTKLSMGLTENLKKLRTFCAVLNENVDKSLANDDCVQNEEYLSHVLEQVMGELNGGETLSTFEFIGSGIVRSLAHFLSNGKYLLKNRGNCDLSKHFLAVLKRFQTFASISLSKADESWEDMHLTRLIQKLQNALSSSDHFPVILNHVSKPKTIHADVPVRRSVMYPCLNVRFMREERETDLSDYVNVVTVEPSSSLDAIEGFLWPKVSINRNEHRAESVGKAVIETGDIAVRSKCSEGRQGGHPELLLECEKLHSRLLKVLQEVDIRSTKSRELMTETTSNIACSGEGRVESRVHSRSNEDAQPKLIFSLKGRQLDRSITLYQAILQDQIDAGLDMTVGSKFWKKVYSVTYKRTEEPKQRGSQIYYDTFQSPLSWDAIGLSWQKLSFFSSLLVAELPCKLDKSNPSYDILFMLKILEGLNRFSFHLLSSERSNAFAEGRIESLDDLKVRVPSVPQTKFLSSKLTDKLERQMSDPLALSTGSMPSWCSQLMAACPFLFSFEARRKYFLLTAFDSPRIQQHGMQHSSRNNINSVNERRSDSRMFSRKKFKVNRRHILESAAEMMALHSRSKDVLEVEYNEEVGTGLGPTMEFYTLVSHEFRKVGLGLWREDHDSFTAQLHPVVGNYGFVVAPCGLFPRPWSAATSFSSGVHISDVNEKFVLLGRLVAKAIKDGRTLDLPFSRAFYKAILEQELDIHDIQSFDPDLGKTLLEFQTLVKRKRFLESITGENSTATSDLCFRDMSIEDLCLDFTLPSYPDYVLMSGSNLEMVNITNLDKYVSLAVDATVRSGIYRQLEAFKSGFNEVFPLKNLKIFTEDELELLLCGEQDTWTFSELLDHINFDHGYTASSFPVISLLETIQEFGGDLQRAFIQFVTGAPHLPLGGLAALNPKMTIVRKHCSDDADMHLPSVMTCTNYLKLPPYSSKEITRQRLLYAITEGQGSFHLS